MTTTVIASLDQVPDAPAGPFPGADEAVAGALSVPRVQVTMADGRVLEVQATNPDLIAYEDTAARLRWPGMDKAPLRWLTYVGWAALRRTGQLPVVDGEDLVKAFNAFMADTVQVAGVAAPVRPTPPDPGPG